MKNLGNFSFRLLKFIEGSYNKVVPEFTNNTESQDYCMVCLQEVWAEFLEYVKLMEAVKIKDGIHKAMSISSVCNKYMQKWEPWKTAKVNPTLAASAMNTLTNVFILLCAILEPFIPTFSAKIYEMFNWKRGEKEETLLGSIYKEGNCKSILNIIPKGHIIQEPFAIFRESKKIHIIIFNIVPAEEIEALKKKYGGGHI